MRSYAALTSLVITAAFLSACAGPPTGNSAGRVDSSTVTPADASSDHVLNASLVEFAERSAEDLITALADRTIYGITDNDQLIVVYLGDIMNKTQGTVSSNDFEMVSMKIRTALIRSSLARQKISFRENRVRQEGLSARERGSAVEREMSEPEYTYFLNGNMFRTGAAGSIHYYMEFQLMNEATGDLPWVKEFHEDRN